MATKEDYRAILLPGESFGVSQIARYKDRAHKKKLFKGEYITTVARSIDDPYYYYIDEGQILTTFTDDSGEGAVVAWRSAGNAFSGEYNDFASIGKYKARHVAAKNTVLFVFSQRQLYEIAKEDPEVFYEFVHSCHIHFAQMAHRLSGTGNTSTARRLAMWLQKLCYTSDVADDGSCFIPCKITIKQIADMLRIHITTATKLLASFEDAGIISRTKEGILICDVNRLDSVGME